MTRQREIIYALALTLWCTGLACLFLKSNIAMSEMKYIDRIDFEILCAAMDEERAKNLRDDYSKLTREGYAYSGEDHVREDFLSVRGLQQPVRKRKRDGLLGLPAYEG